MKRFLFVAALLALALTLALSMNSCNNGNNNPPLINTEDPSSTPDTTEPPSEHIHEYIASVVDPTCTEPGYTLHLCSCGDTYTDTPTEALGHSFGEWTTAKAATCTATGTETRTCTRCGETETRDIPLAAHSYTGVVTPPTKTTQGKTTHTCSVCKDSYVDSYTNPTGSVGLSYTVNSDGTLTITGIGSCTDEDVILYSTYYVEDGSVKTITAIAQNAFEGNSTIKTFAIPASLSGIGEGAFAGCSRLTAFTVEADNQNFSVSGGMLCSKDGATIIVYPAGNSATSFTIALGITAIRPSAFAGCSKLTEFKLAENHKYFAVAGGVLYNIDKTTLISYPAGKLGSSFEIPSSVSKIGGYAFFRNSALASVNLPERLYDPADTTKILNPGISTIGGYAFYGCTELTAVIFPNATTTLESYAFANCAKLADITFGSGLSEIASHSFENCTAIVELTIPATVETIGESAFYNCSGIKTLVLGSGVKKISAQAFMGCLNHGKDASGKEIGKVLYQGGSDDWMRLFNSGVDQTNTIYLTIYAGLYYYSETAPAGGNYWRYVSGVATPW